MIQFQLTDNRPNRQQTTQKTTQQTAGRTLDEPTARGVTVQLQ